MYHNADSQMLE